MLMHVCQSAREACQYIKIVIHHVMIIAVQLSPFHFFLYRFGADGCQPAH